jgi:cobalt-zinc-cadmium efflux system outer membrane protein
MRPTHVHTRRALLGVPVAIALGLAATPAWSQLPVTREMAERAALMAGPRVALARADSAEARAALITAHARPNPSLVASYTADKPTKHLSLDIPFDAPWTRRPRGSAAQAAERAASLRLLSERTAAQLEVDTTYTMALAAQARFRLMHQTARDADSLRSMAVARMNAGDASELDVQLASVLAGQQANAASTDSLGYMHLLLAVQMLMGIPADSVAIVLADSLDFPRGLPAVGTTVAIAPVTAARADSTSIALSRLTGAALDATPFVAAAFASVEAAELSVAHERRMIWGVPSLQVGVDWGDPANDPPNKLLPLVGVSIPLPLLDRNRGPIAQAEAQRDRARAELQIARLEVHQRLVEGARERETLVRQVARDRDLVVRADRVSAMSLQAYREGAMALPAVLEARRTAREVLSQYIDDLASLLTVEAELRALTRTTPSP